MTVNKEQKKSVDIAKLTELFLSKNRTIDINNSTLKGLDLAFPIRQRISIKQPSIQINIQYSAEDIKLKSNDEESKQSLSIFSNQHGSKFLGIIKSENGASRRASSDEIDSRIRNDMFFEHISSFVDAPMSISLAETDEISTITDRNIYDKNIEVQESDEFVTRFNNEMGFNGINCINEASIHNKDYKFEKPEIPHIRFGTFNNSAQKTNNIEISEVSTESESHYEDTLSSTQFGSECADLKSDDINTASINAINFLSASSQEAIDATDLNQVRKNLELCALDDESEIKNNQSLCVVVNSSEIINDKKFICNNIERNDNTKNLLIFSARISSESEDDSNAQDGSPIVNDNAAATDMSTKFGKETNRILNFSGQIPNPENHSEYHLAKSPIEMEQQKISSTNIVTMNDEKNLTFAGKIRNEQSKFSRSNPTIIEKIPKFIIKKIDSLSKSSSLSQIFSSEQVTQQSNETKVSSDHISSVHPKIPKMIIRNVRSRPVTPTIEENAVELSFPKDHESEQKVFEVKIKLDDSTIKHEVEASSLRKAIGVIECKIPKMKIKLEDRIPKMIFKNAKLEMFDNNNSTLSKNISKVKIRKLKRSNSKEEKILIRGKEKILTNLDNLEQYNATEKFKESTRDGKSSEFNKRIREEPKQERIPKLKIKKQDASSLSLDSGKKKTFQESNRIITKKPKKIIKSS